MPQIDHYSFGKMTIDGKKFDFDLIITEGKIETNWWRNDGHKLHLSDLETIIDKVPAKLIIGTGARGRMIVPTNVKNELEEMGFETYISQTEKAVQIYNKTESPKIGAFHLTC